MTAPLDQTAFNAIAEASRKAAQEASALTAGELFAGQEIDQDQVMFACVSGLATAAGNGLASLAMRDRAYGTVKAVEGVASQLVHAFAQSKLMRKSAND